MSITTGTAGSFRAAGYERAKGDLYETPEWCVYALFNHWNCPDPIREPSAGRGAIVRALRKLGRTVVATDLHDWGSESVQAGVDFLAEKDLRGCQTVIMNPPYGNDAAKHVRHAWELLPENGEVAALLRWNWIAAKSRVDWLGFMNTAIILGRVNMPPHGIVDKGHTATTDYAWFIFGKKAFGRCNIVRNLS